MILKLRPHAMRRFDTRFGVDPLEGRLLLATVTWDGGGADDNWHNALNWGTNVVPATGDDVVINATAGSAQVTFSATTGTVSVNSITCAEPFVLTGGSLTVTAASGTGATFTSTYNQSGGTYTNNASRTLFQGVLTFSGGTMQTNSGFDVRATGSTSSGGVFSGNGELDLGSGVAFNYSGSNRTITDLNFDINNGSSVTWSATGTTTLNSDVLFFVDPTGTLRFNAGGSSVTLAQGTGAGASFRIGGTVQHNGSGIVTIGPEVRTDATAAFSVAGTLMLNGGDGVDTTDADFSTLSAAAVIEFGGGDWQFSSDVAVSGTGLLTIDGATISMAGAISPGRLTIASGVLSSDVSQDWGEIGFLMTGGTLTAAQAAATLMIRGSWSGGVWNGAGRFETATSPDFLTISGNVTLNGALHVGYGGRLDWTDGDITMIDGTISVVALEPETGTGVFNINNNDEILNGGGANLLDLQGVITKQGPAGQVTTINVPVSTVITFAGTSGIVTVVTGSLELAGGGVYENDFVLNGGLLLLDGGTHTFNIPCGISGAGDLLVNSGTVTGLGPFTNTGSTEFRGGAVTISSTPNAFACGPLSFTGAQVTVNAVITPSGDVTISAGTVSLSQDQAWAVITITGGTLTGAGDLTSTDAFFWSGGTMSGTGQTLLDNGGPNGIQGNVTLSRTLVLGTLALDNNLIWSGGNISFNNGTIHIVDGSTWTAALMSAGTMSMLNAGGTNRIINDEDFIKTGPSTVIIAVDYDTTSNAQSDTNVQGGSLRLTGGGTQDGEFSISAGGTLEFGGGAFTIGAGTDVIGGGLLKITAGSVIGLGPFTNTAGAQFSGGTTTIDAAASFTSGPITVSGANTAVSTSQTINPTGGFTMSGGSMTTTAFQSWAVTISGGLLVNNSPTSITINGLWSGGTLDGSQIRTADLDIAGNVTLSAPLLIIFTAAWTNGDISMTGGSITVDRRLSIDDLDPVFVVSNDDDILNTSGVNSVNVNGRLTKTGGLTVINVPTNSSAAFPTLVAGDLVVESGTLRLAGGGTLNGDSVLVSAGAVFEISGGTTDFGTDTLVLGDGNLLVSGGEVSIGIFRPTGGATFSGGTVSIATILVFNGAGPIMFSGATVTIHSTITTVAPVTISAGTVTVNVSQNWSSLIQTGGTLILNGDGTRADNTTIISGPWTWSGGTVRTNVITGSIQNNGTLTISGSVTLGTDLINAGVVNWNGGNISMIGATITLASGSDFNCTASGTINNTSGTNLITSIADLNKTGTGTTTINVRLVQTNDASADVFVNSGTLRLNGGGSHDGDFSVSAGATLQFGGGSHDFLPGQNLIGGGAVVFSAGANTNLQHFSNTGGLTVSGGSLTIVSASTLTGGPMTVSGMATSLTMNAPVITTGTFTLIDGTVIANNQQVWAGMNIQNGLLTGSGAISLTGSSSWSGGIMAGIGTTTLQAGATLAFTSAAAKSLTRTLNIGGSATWSDGAISMSNSLINILPGGMLDVAFGGLVQNLLGFSQITSSGSVVKSGLGTATFAVPFHQTIQAATTAVTSGTLRLTGGGTHHGDWTVSAGSAVEFAGGSHAFHEDSAVSGSGNILVSAGTVSNLGPFTNTGGLTVTQGTTTIQSATSFVSGPITVSGPLANAVINSAMTIGVLNLSAGTVAINNSVTITSLNQTGGTLIFNVPAIRGEDSPVIVGGTWSGGTLNAASGQVAITGALTIPATVTMMGEVNILGTVHWTGGNLNLSNASLGVAIGGILAASSNGILDDAGGINVLHCAGSLIKSGPSDLIIEMPLNNGGLVEIQAGRFRPTHGTHSGRFAIGAGAQLNPLNGTNDYLDGAQIDGPGRFVIDAGNQRFVPAGAGLVTINAPMRQSSSFISGVGEILLTADVEWTGGTWTGSGTTRIGPGATLCYTGGEIFTSRLRRNIEIAANGLMEAEGEIGFLNGRITVLAGGELRLGNVGLHPDRLGGDNRIDNFGVITKTTASTITVGTTDYYGEAQPLFLNNFAGGQVLVQQGTLEIHTVSELITPGEFNELAGGLWKVSDGAVLQFPIDIHRLDGSLWLDGFSATVIGMSALAENVGSIRLSDSASMFVTPFGGTFTNTGELDIGPGSLFEVFGSFVQGSAGLRGGGGGILKMGIAGAEPSMIGRLTATESLSLGGTLEVNFLGYVPTSGESFALLEAPIIEGQFDEVVAPQPAPGQRFTGLAADGAFRIIVSLPGDWNNDNTIDSQDFFDFLEGFFNGDADFNDDGGTDSQDYFDFLEAFFSV